MNRKINISRENTNAEVLARIIKATSLKYNCSMTIDFSGHNRITSFVGDKALKPHIAEEVQKIFTN